MSELIQLSGDGVNPNQSSQGGSTFDGKAFADALDNIEDSNYVFFFGLPGSGKSAIIGSILRMLHENSANIGSFILNDGSRVKENNLCKTLLNNGAKIIDGVLQGFNKREFMARTTKGDVIVVNGRFIPDEHIFSKTRYPQLDVTFLDVSGEDLETIQINDGAGKLPSHINIFLKLARLPLLIVLVVPHNNAVKDKDKAYTDRLMAKFLNQVHNRTSRDNLKKPRIILLVTQWDSYSGKYVNNVKEFAKDKLPATYALLNKDVDLVSEYSIGHVIEDDAIPYIDVFYEDYPTRLWNRIYETFTGKRLIKKKWWQFW